MNKVAMLTTVANFDLYHKSNPLFNISYDRFVIDGRNGMHGIHSILYMMRKFKNLDYDYIIMADEDFILKSNTALENLLDYMKTNDIVVSGVRDGGMINHRNYNPFCINTFFSVLDLKKVKQIWNEKEMLSNQRIDKDEFYLDEEMPHDFDVESLYEPYYCFYLWLLRRGEKIKYLNSKTLIENNDDITNIVCDDNEKIIGFHSWYARSYGVNKKHTDRIDLLLNKIERSNLSKVDYVLWKDVSFKCIQTINKFFRKVKMKLKLT